MKSLSSYMGCLATVVCASLCGCGSEAGAPDPGSGTSVPSGPSGSTTPPATGSSPGTPSAPAPVAKLGAPYPVVLMHGMGGFGQLELGPIGITYFDGVVEDLSKKGESVFVTIVPPYDTS